MSGLQPAIPRCFLCGQDHNMILLSTRLTPHHQAQVGKLHKQIISTEPCDCCKGWMEQGIILIGVDEEKSKNAKDVTEVYRSGHFVVVKDGLVEQIINSPTILSDVLKRRVCFMDGKIVEHLQKQYEKFQKDREVNREHQV